MSDPRIYVASLSDYNAGILHGIWIDLDCNTLDSVNEEISSMLALSPTAQREGFPAEEYAIHDYEGFGEIKLSEYESIATVVEIAELLSEHGDAYAAFYANEGSLEYATAERFEECYRGEWSSVEEYAENLAEDIAPSLIDGSVWPYYCIDWERAARELVIGGDIWTADSADGVYVFSNY